MKIFPSYRVGCVWAAFAIILTPLCNFAQAACVTPPSGLISWWRAEGNGMDSMGGHDAIVSSGVNYVSGKVGQAFSLNGTDTNRIMVPDNVALDFGSDQDFSIEAWIHPEIASTTFGVMDIVDKRYVPPPYPQFFVALGYELSLVNGKLAFQLASGSSASNFGETGADLRDGAFHHVAVTVVRNSAIGGKMYVDGQLIATFDPTGYSGDLSNSEPLRIGNHPDPTFNSFFKGLIDEVSIYNRSLSASEIQALYNAGSAGKCANSLPTNHPPVADATATTALVISSNNSNAPVVLNGSLSSDSDNDPLQYFWYIAAAPTFSATGVVASVTLPVGTNHITLSVTDGLATNVQSITVQVITTTEPICLPAPSGTVGWWRGEGNTTDTVSGVAGTNISVSFAAGKVGQAFDFNGTNAHVEIASRNELKFTGPFTVEAWVNFDSTGHNNTIVTKGAVVNGAADWAFFVSDSNRLRPHAMVNGSWAWFDCNTSLTTNTWYHAVMVFDGAHLQGYLNGVLDGSGNISGAVQATDGTLRMGAYRPDETANRFDGRVDELTLYNRALSASEIQALYNAGSAGKCMPITPLVGPTIVIQPTSRAVNLGDATIFSVEATGPAPLSYQWLLNGQNILLANSSNLTVFNVQSNSLGNYSVRVTNPGGSTNSAIVALTLLPFSACASAPAGLVSWWRFQNDAMDAADSNNGTLQFSSLFVGGKVGQALNLGNGSRFMIVPNPPSLRLTNAMSIEAWVYPTNQTGVRTIVSRFDYPLGSPALFNSSYYLGTTNGSAFFMVSPNGAGRTNFTVKVAQALASNQWSFVAATYDGTALRIYVNGTLGAQTNYSGGIFPGTASLGIGAIPFSSQFALPFVGYLDEVSIYNRALSAGEIQSLYNAGSAGICTEAPSIIVHPQSQAVPQNEDVLFTVGVQGTRPLRYQWRFNGQNLFRATNATLLLEKVQSNNIGNYSVVVSNFLGSATSSNAALTLLPPLSCVTPPDGMISWWPADSSAIDAFDGNNGFFQGATLSISGKVSRAFSFNGNGGRVLVNNSPSLNFGSNANFSIEGWIKVLPTQFQPQSSSNVPLIEKRSTTTFGQGYSISLYEGRLALWLGSAPASPTNSSMFISNGPDLRDGMFHHIAMLLSRNTTDGGILLVDGQVVLTFDATARKGDLSNTLPLMIGAPITTLSNSFFSGLIDELAIYNRALSTNEIQSIYNAGSAGKCKVPPSIITQPISQLVNEGTSNVTFTVSAAGSATLRYQWLRFGGVPISGATNPVYIITNVPMSAAGLYSVRVTNAFGSITSSNVTLTVNRLPIARCQDFIVSAGSNCNASVNIDNGSSDPDNDPITITQIPAGPYPSGTNIVTLTVADNRGGSNFCIATVIVQDTTPPTLICPADIVVPNDLNQCGAVVTFPALVATDTCSGVSNNFAPPSGSFFPVGSTTVYCTATDGAGNASSCWFTVTVGDVQPPTIICPTDIVVTNAHDRWATAVTFTPTASDNCSGIGSIVCTPASGSEFAIGTNVVVCLVTDGAGNSNQCAFNIIVHPGNQPPVPVIKLSPLVFFPGHTNLVIAPDGTNASVVFDGSLSSDPDDSVFLYFWMEGTTIFSTNVVATNTLIVGAHDVRLLLDDTFPLGTNSATVTANIISPATAVGYLIDMVNSSTMPSSKRQVLKAILESARASFERGRINEGVVRLRVFQLVTRLLLFRTDPGLSGDLIQAAQQIIDAERNSILGRGQIAWMKSNNQGKMRLHVDGIARERYTIQASTNMVHWQNIGTVETDDNGALELEDSDAAKYPARFYRVVRP